MKINTVSIALIILAIAFSGCSTTNTTKASSNNQAIADRYHIGASDVLTINVWNRSNLDRSVTVRPDGKISFPLVGDIYVAGLQPTELQLALEEALRKYMKVIPGEVSVTVDEVHSYKVSVLGEVRAPGRFEFQTQVSILEALAQAGGLTEFATRDRILIIRNYLGNKEDIVFDYQKAAKLRGGSDPLMLLPGDVVLVP
ncbi:polysaccharide export outer membrane protein [Litorivivens lipolytica]|uniref:Polysaccharide export outer membrane protein n=1 Tax=Litorivivens lipolytica TaxID=1524264 RepID=A0A7W4W6I9_9GAMM|nr:polysaccharide biosynthesis/export family protein [Litorivivens lipolytica]MBB3047819.1 polysaccharide export outer membrane protein [Litorivivens lipolytica]